MTDARLPDRWLMDEALVELSPTAWRFFTFALMLSNAQGTDGRITQGQLRFIPFDVSAADIEQVIATGRLQRVSGGYQFRDWASKLGQSPAASVEARREQNRINQANTQNRRKQGASGRPASSDVAADVSADDGGEARDRPGQEGLPTSHDAATGHARGWPSAVPGRPQDDGYCNECGKTTGHTSTCDQGRRAA